MPSSSNTPRSSTSFPLPFTTVDLVIFSLRDQQLTVLLVKRPAGPHEPFPEQWALPGGYVDVDRDASLQACAERKLLEKTGVVAPYLEQLGSWGGKQRDPRGWSATHVYFALMASSELTLTKGANAAEADWWPVTQALASMPLAFDHSAILAAAHGRLLSKVEYTSLPAYLLPEPFTLPQLQAVYEQVLGRALDKSAFRTRMLSGGFLVEDGTLPGHSKRPAMGYRLADPSRPTQFPRTFKPA